MKHIRILILRVRLWFNECSIVLNQKELYNLGLKEKRLEKKLKALGHVILTDKMIDKIKYGNEV